MWVQSNKREVEEVLKHLKSCSDESPISLIKTDVTETYYHLDSKVCKMSINKNIQSYWIWEEEL